MTITKRVMLFLKKRPYLRRLVLGGFVAAFMRFTDQISSVFEGATIMILVVILLYVVNPPEAED